MDSLTHIYFAHKLLTMCGKDTSAAVCSLFPQIDRTPAYYHRMYAHPFFQVDRLVQVGMSVYRTGEIPSQFTSSYEWSRFRDDRLRMLSFASRFEAETDISLSAFNPDKVSASIAYVSHTYQDVFNNPMQAFLPRWTYPCGQWDLWAQLGAIEFRTMLYAPENISSFRKEFFTAPLWNHTLEPLALVKAMVRRTAASCVVSVPQRIVDEAFDALDLGGAPDPQAIEEAEAWLVEHELLLADMMEKHSRPMVANAPVPVPSLPERS